MPDRQKKLIDELQQRGLLYQTTAQHELQEHLADQSRTLYCGFDPTADSLHLGHLIPLLVLRRFQMAGHRPIALVGGATGLIGDPSFKSSERQLNSIEVVSSWGDKIRTQLQRFLDFDCGKHSALLVNNLEWTSSMGMLDFLRDIGKHFSVNAMIQKESVRQRIAREGTGISFTEFSYALLQGMDFAELNRRYNCTVQIGGSDQWGNIVGGIELARKQTKAQTYGLTVPLVKRADGVKFGKTEQGTVWLDSKKTSEYAFYQFWINVADADVYTFLRLFTFLDLDELISQESSAPEQAQQRVAQTTLACEMTKLVHGQQGLASAQRITNALFSSEYNSLSEDELKQLRQDGLPSSSFSFADLKEKTLSQFLSGAGVASGKQLKDALGRKSVAINGTTLSMADNMEPLNAFTPERAFYQRFFLVQVGKRKHHLFELSEQPT